MERQLQLKTQQQFTKEYMEAKGLKEEQEVGQGPGPGPGSTSIGSLPLTAGALAFTGSDTDEEATRDGEKDELPVEEDEEVRTHCNVQHVTLFPTQSGTIRYMM